jgi:hypothetical protein
MRKLKITAEYVNKVLEHAKIALEYQDANWKEFDRTEETMAVLFVMSKFIKKPSSEEVAQEANCYLKHLDTKKGVYKYAPDLGADIKIAEPGNEITMFPLF